MEESEQNRLASSVDNRDETDVKLNRLLRVSCFYGTPPNEHRSRQQSRARSFQTPVSQTALRSSLQKHLQGSEISAGGGRRDELRVNDVRILFSCRQMPLNPRIDPVNVVDLDSSDDEDGNVVTPSSSSAGTPSSGRAGAPPSLWVSHQLTASTPATAGESRCFWRAGACDVVSAPAATTAGGSRLIYSTTSNCGLTHSYPSVVPYSSYDIMHCPLDTGVPSMYCLGIISGFLLHAAIAELLDNAVDETPVKGKTMRLNGVKVDDALRGWAEPGYDALHANIIICNGATFIKVDRIYNKRDNSPDRIFLADDGGGMDPESIRKCVSLGYSSKKTNTTIGQCKRNGAKAHYADGNGFKTSTMRLGADVIVFSRKLSGSRATQSIGLLSYTFLRRTGQDDIIVPMVDFDIVNGRAQPIIYSSQEDWIDNFKIILEWSPFSSKEELMLQFEDIESHGTKIIVFNLWLNDDGVYELDFDEEEEGHPNKDIRLRDEANLISMSKSPEAKMQSHISYYIRYSLRAYTSVLYLRKFTNFCIILRGKPVEQRNIADELKFSKVIAYKPLARVASKEVLLKKPLVSRIHVAELQESYPHFLSHSGEPFMKVPAGERVLWSELPTDQHMIGHAAASGIEHNSSSQSMHGQNTSNLAYTPVSFVRNGHQDSVESSYIHGHIQQSMMRTTEFGEGFSEETAPGAISGPALVDKICNENIQLFLRCEEHRQKESALKETIENLESELAEARRRCSQLASNVEQRKKTVVDSLTSPQ
ncbi:hypothetical protein ACLOJK_031772 [Asimina triloba]